MIPADASQALRVARRRETYSHDHRDLLFFLVDVDYFKAVNDEYGHDAGDKVLVQIAQRLGRVVRESDFLIRWGGEEFLVICRSAERTDGPILADRILKAINGEDFDIGQGRCIPQSCSVGWAPYPWLPPMYSDLSVDEVLRLADRGLYLAKEHGRNQAVGLMPATATPARPGKYALMEELFTDGMVRELRTTGQMIRVVGSSA